MAKPPLSLGVVTLLLIISVVQFCEGAKIVGFPTFAGSQYIGMKRIGQELVSRGHEVVLLVSSAQRIKETDGIKHAVYQVPYEKDFLENVLVKQYLDKGLMGIVSIAQNARRTLATFCEAVVNSTELLEPLKKYDMIITDTSSFCGPLVAEYLNITRIEYCPISARNPLMYYHHVPAFLSYVPTLKSVNPGKMSFLQRVKNTLVYVNGLAWIQLIVYRDMEDIKQRYNINPEKSYIDAIGDAEMVLYLSDTALDYSFPLLPGHKLIGALNVHPPRPLSPEFQTLVDSSGEHGVVIVSFGTNVASVLKKNEVDMLADAFGRLKETVIWRLKGYIPPEIGPNIKIVEWMPQVDLLAHEKMRAFVSHAGQNSLYEAAFYGVPIVAVPIFGDQPDNAMLIEEKGLGLSIDIHTDLATVLYSRIRTVIDDPRFKANAQRISRLMKDRPRTPVQEAGDWVEYTLRHGRLTHLRPASIHLTWYQYFLLDVMLFLVTVLVAVAMVIRLIWKCLCGLCCRRAKKAKVQ